MKMVGKVRNLKFKPQSRCINFYIDAVVTEDMVEGYIIVGADMLMKYSEPIRDMVHFDIDRGVKVLESAEKVQPHQRAEKLTGKLAVYNKLVAPTRSIIYIHKSRLS